MTERPDIAIILRHYGADDVPTSYNWRPMRCPFHDDRNASAQVNTDEGFFRCFTCDLFGDGFELVKIREGVNFKDAKRICAQLAGEGDSSLREAAGSGSGVSGKAWYLRGGGKKGPSGGGRYTGTYSR